MTAQELMNLPAANTWGKPLSHPDSQGYVAHELSTRKGLRESIKEHGVTDEVIVDHETGTPTLVEGHHRVMTAHSIDPDMRVPVIHWR